MGVSEEKLCFLLKTFYICSSSGISVLLSLWLDFQQNQRLKVKFSQYCHTRFYLIFAYFSPNFIKLYLYPQPTFGLILKSLQNITILEKSMIHFSN